MTRSTIHICGMGIVSSLGTGLAATTMALRENCSAIKPLDLFPVLHGAPLPVGQVSGLPVNGALPRTHRLASLAAKQAMTGAGLSPEAIVIGTTTGGIATTEQLLREGSCTKELYQYHGLHTVARHLAGELGCTGPALTVSTACSSGAVAIALALRMLRSGMVKSVLAGGVDSLSRLTYYGFHSLQLVDRNGCKPLDAGRQGMAVAEGAAMLLLTAEHSEKSLATLAGAGLSCDAHHGAAPHPEGLGAFLAMQRALLDAGLQPEDIGYINLHGTGTPDNDLAESKAVRRLFAVPPPLSSIKGASGHSLAASGAIEAVVSVLTVSQGLLPANTSLHTVDPALGLNPLTLPKEQTVSAVLSNSFGFGGNNGSLVIAAADFRCRDAARQSGGGLAIHGYSCLTGAGDLAATMAVLATGVSVAGMAGTDALSAGLPLQLIRRLKRLPRISLALATMAHKDSGDEGQKPGSVFMGTGWGALSETYDFLARLTETGEQFPSPTDFVGSVHNGPASQVAIMFGATGPNITTSGGDYSFEQALLAADLACDDDVRPVLILGAEEGHATFSPLLDASITPGSTLTDGGAAFCATRKSDGAICRITVPFYGSSQYPEVISALIDSLAASQHRQKRYALILAGIPAAMHDQGEGQLAQFLSQTKMPVPVVRYRQFTGEFAAASAVAAAFAVSFIEAGMVPGILVGGEDLAIDTSTSKILILGLGENITAMELGRP
ncbi:MAG: beta-ketoacyl-[acyl-carrier-protein] synthase family protein [Desulforhopalus sp.]|nr:beta-ketoacyl-[acyl-carrier-protein] synthase family protein [Desulforhopalus sp.]